MKRLTPSDAMFLYGESREQMMHVAAMMPFTSGRVFDCPSVRKMMMRRILSERPWSIEMAPT